MGLRTLSTKYAALVVGPFIEATMPLKGGRELSGALGL